MNSKLWLLVFWCSIDTLAYEFKQGGWKESDIPTELTNPISEVLEKIKSGSEEDFFSKKQDLEAEAKYLNNIQDLDTAGRQKQLTEGELINSILIDSNALGISRHARDAKDIAQATAKLLKNIVQGLKQNNGIDCIEYKADPAIANSYCLHKSHRRSDYIADEPFLCEHLRNTYNCEDNLEIRCLQFRSRPENMRITGANFNYDVNRHIMSFKHKYDSNKSSSKTKNTWFENWALDYKKYVTRYELAHTKMYINFEVTLDPKVLSEFSLYNVYYTGYVLIKLNDNVVFAGPDGGNILEYIERKEVLDRVDNIPFPLLHLIYKHEYYSSYPVIWNGKRTINLGQYSSNTSSRHVGNIDLRTHLRKGSNVLTIEGYSATYGYINAEMQSHERICDKWSEPKWNETCILQAN